MLWASVFRDVAKIQNRWDFVIIDGHNTWVKCNLKVSYLNTAYNVIFQPENLSSQTSIFPGSRLLSSHLWCLYLHLAAQLFWDHAHIMVYWSICHYLPYSIHFSEFIMRKRTKHKKYSKSAIFVWYKNGRGRFLGTQSINAERASLIVC